MQWALNTAFRPRYGSTPYHVMFGRAPRTSFSVLANSSAEEWNCEVLDDDQIKRALKDVLELQEQFHVQVQELRPPRSGIARSWIMTRSSVR